MAAVPDPRKGVFETLLVRDGRPVEWDAHMARLRASLAALYPGRAHPPLDTQAEGTEVLRITVAPDAAGDLVAEIERRPALSSSSRYPRATRQRSRSPSTASPSPAASARTSGPTARCSTRHRRTCRTAPFP